MQSLSIFRARLHKGLSLVETAVYLALAAVIAASGMAFYNSFRRDRAVQNTALATQELILNIRDYFNNTPNFDGITSSFVQAKGMIRMSLNDPSIGGLSTGIGAVSLYVWGSRAMGVADREFRIGFYPISSSSVCANLASIPLDRKFLKGIAIKVSTGLSQDSDLKPFIIDAALYTPKSGVQLDAVLQACKAATVGSGAVVFFLH